MGETRSSRRLAKRLIGKRRVILAALVANAIKPLDTEPTAVPAFALGWPTSELAPQILAATIADTAWSLARKRVGVTGTLLAAGSAAGLEWIIAKARESARVAEEALREGIGADYALQYDGADDVECADIITPADLARPFHFRDADIEVTHNVHYTTGGKRALLDIYRPRRPLAHAPVLIQIHGGGWTIGQKEEQGRLLMNRMAKLGWVCVAVNYRLSPKHKWPTHVIDVKRSIAWVRENIADYGGDPDYLVLTGGSAGGHLSSLAALSSTELSFQPGFEYADTSVAACVPFYGVYDMLGEDEDRYTVGLRDQFLAARVFGIDDVPAHLDTFRRASPLHHIDESAPDFFVLHGANDTLVSVRQARAFVARLRSDSRSSVTYAEFPAAQHAFDVFGSIRARHAVAAAQRWLQWHHRKWRHEQASAVANTA